VDPQNKPGDSLLIRLQDYLREIAIKSYDAVPCSPFTLFFHPNDALIFFNYAIPDGRVVDDFQGVFPEVRKAFAARNRRARFEFIEEYSPQLARAIASGGFEEESRLHLMLCTPRAFRAAPQVEELNITVLDGRSPLRDAQDFLTTRSAGFEGESAAAATESEAERFVKGVGRSRTTHFLGRMDGKAVGVASYSAPLRGLTEVAGITTIEAYRGQGIGSALTSFAVQEAFGHGVNAAFLSAADQRADRVYRRLGFRATATALAYIDPQE
jgi:GNAT superfamily N-acetyltransferase